MYNLHIHIGFEKLFIIIHCCGTSKESKLPVDQLALATYGQDELSLLCRKYQQKVDEEAAQIEWDGLKQSR